LQKTKQFSSIIRAISFVKKYHTVYGTSKAIRATCHYGFRILKKLNKSHFDKPVMINNYNMFLIPDDYGISKELSVFKSHEPINTKIISKILKKGMTCIDIGGNIGYYVLLERKLVGKDGKIIAIEPYHKNFQYLKKNIKLQNTENILAFNFACGDKEGKVPFYINKKSNGCQVIREDVKLPDLSKGTLTEVPIKTLDSIVDELKLDHVDFVRMDAEGYELHILRGLKKTLAKFKPIISLELHKRQLGMEGTRDFFKMMKELNYEIESYIPRDLDVPLIGTMKDVKKPSIDELLEMIEKGKIGSYLMLNLVNWSNMEQKKL
jgi:FkbM family methyltransferase